ncbi:MAG: cytochrome C [Castellaniella sp.]|uniref:cytochrome C n=1 Tax=Castellaniella sp. TaxID=1955812 RepID=UPI003A8A60DA
MSKLTNGIGTGLLLCLVPVLTSAAVLRTEAKRTEDAAASQAAMLQAMGSSTSAYKDYMLNCGGCHRFDGEGVARNAVPSFRNSVGLFTHLPEGREYMIRVPGAAQSLLDNAELANVLNWMVANFSPGAVASDFRPFTAAEVGAVRPYRFDDVAAERRQITTRLLQMGLTPAPYLYGSN